VLGPDHALLRELELRQNVDLQLIDKSLCKNKLVLPYIEYGQNFLESVMIRFSQLETQETSPVHQLVSDCINITKLKSFEFFLFATIDFHLHVGRTFLSQIHLPGPENKIMRHIIKDVLFGQGFIRCSWRKVSLSNIFYHFLSNFQMNLIEDKVGNFYMKNVLNDYKNTYFELKLHRY